jgi:hypothetical protein
MKDIRKDYAFPVLLIIIVLVIAGIGAYVYMRTSDQPENFNDGFATDTSGQNVKAADVIGTYKSNIMPASSGPGRQYELIVGNDSAKTATFISDYLKEDSKITERGTWTLTPTGTLIVMLEERNGIAYKQSNAMTFKVIGTTLELQGVDASLWGTDGLSLKKID